jgi:hypothetical protein
MAIVKRHKINARYACSAALIAAATTIGTYYWRGATEVEHIYAESRNAERATVHANVASRHFTMGHYGDYALIMLAGDNAPLALFSRTTRALIDERLLIAWARAHERSGDTARAEFLMARAREFSALRDHIPANAVPTAASKPLSARDFRN